MLCFALESSWDDKIGKYVTGNDHILRKSDGDVTESAIELNP